jgi:hypothetical protein
VSSVMEKKVLHPADEAPDVRNLAYQVGALPRAALATPGRGLPLT